MGFTLTSPPRDCVTFEKMGAWKNPAFSVIQTNASSWKETNRFPQPSFQKKIGIVKI